MNINEATMSVNIAGVPRPFRIITKEQGKKEYGAPFYEQVAGTLRGVADKIRSSASDARSARTMVKETFEKLGMEPVQKAGFLTQLMRYKDAAALADALYDITIDGPDGQAFVVGESELNDQKSSFSEAWDAQSEDERAKHLSMAGYDGEELSAYKKFTWDNLPPAVRNHVEVVMESYNPGAADIRLPFHGDNIPKAEVEPEAEEPAPEAEEEPAEEEPAEEEPAGDVVFENAMTAVNFFRKMSGMTEAEEPKDGKAPGVMDDPEAKADAEAASDANAYKPEPADARSKTSEDPELLALLAKAAAGDNDAAGKVAMKYRPLIKKMAADAAAIGNAYSKKMSSPDRQYGRLDSGDMEDLASDGLMIAVNVAKKFDPEKGVRFSTFLTRKLLDLRNTARGLVAKKVGTVSGDEKVPSKKFGSAGDDSGNRLTTFSKEDVAKVLAQRALLPDACVKAIDAAVDALAEPVRTMVRLAFGFDPALARKINPNKDHLSFRDIANYVVDAKLAPTMSHEYVRKLVYGAISDLAVDKVIKGCWQDVNPAGPDEAAAKRFDPDFDLAGFLGDEDYNALFESGEFLEYPSDMVAKNMEALMLAEGVKVRRKGRRIHVPVNEYGRAKKAFEKHGLTIPKKMVSNDGETVRKMTRFAGLYGASILDTPH
jgi:hypothetical protein